MFNYNHKNKKFILYICKDTNRPTTQEQLGSGLVSPP